MILIKALSSNELESVSNAMSVSPDKLPTIPRQPGTSVIEKC